MFVRRSDVLDHGDRVGQHVLVSVDRIVLQPHVRQLGEELIRQPGVDQEPEPIGGMVHDDQLVEFVTDALRRHDLEPWCHLLHRGDQLVARPELVPRDEARRPQHPERIVAEADLRSERGPQDALHQIDRTVERVDELGSITAGGQLERHGIDREVAS